VRVLCQGAVAVGVDGLIIEVHPNPAEALSDGQQQVNFEGFAQLMSDLKPLLAAMGRTL
jgi:3-deoxy-7-phosphoheptulonate synthase